MSRTDTVSINGRNTVNDVLGTVPGITIGDNGGYAGLKTVALRGLGSAQTAIFVDGMQVRNLQSGQTDLGMLQMESFSEAAVDYARNRVEFRTGRPAFGQNRAGGSIRLQGGSFGSFKPQGRMDLALSRRTALSASAGGVLGRGDFPYGDGLKRNNNDIRRLQGGIDLWSDFDGGECHAKAYANSSRRGVPGSVLWPSSDRQEDLDAFLQCTVRRQFTGRYLMGAGARCSIDDIRYISGASESRYREMGLQLNSIHHLKLRPWLDAALEARLGYDKLEASDFDASRLSFKASAGGGAELERLTADITLEYSLDADRGGNTLQSLSPAASLRVSAAEGLDIAAFARRAFRAPTFNELYYPGFGNPDLRPEDALLADIGVEWHSGSRPGIKLDAKAYYFHNHLKDKIISSPSEADPYLWLPYNIGKVEVNGADLKASARMQRGLVDAAFSAAYCFQDARDRTGGSASYGEQIPFVARHSLCLCASGKLKGWSLDAVWKLLRGRRDSSGSLPDCNTLDLTAGKEIHAGRCVLLSIRLTARNLTGCRYELAAGYPMPGRSLEGSMELKFK